MIVNMKEQMQQDTNRAIIKMLGYVPYYISTWGRKDSEPENPPATLHTICPLCFRTLKIENKRDNIKYEDYGDCFSIEGDKWGYQQSKRKGNKVIYTVKYISHGEHLVSIDHNDTSTGCLFRIYEEVEKDD